MLLFILFVHFISAQLIQVVSLTRHGARYPINSFYDGQVFKSLWGELTPVGMRQHYNLGVHFRQEYIDELKFLDPIYNYKQLVAYSTHYNRAIVSMISQFHGLYPNSTILPILDEKLLTPPYHYSDDDTLINPSPLPNLQHFIPVVQNSTLFINCDTQIQKNLQEQHVTIEEMTNKYRTFVNRINSMFNYAANDIVNLSSIFDTIVADKYLNRALPVEFTNDDYVNLRHLHYFSNLLKMGRNFSRAINTPKFNQIIHNFDQAINNKSGQHKWTFNSCHDTDLNPLMIGLNISSSSCIEQLYRFNKTNALNCEPGPQFAASLIFELHRQSGQAYVKVRYNGKYVYLCENKLLQCPYAEFKRRLELQNLNNYIELCK